MIMRNTLLALVFATSVTNIAAAQTPGILAVLPDTESRTLTVTGTDLAGTTQAVLSGMPLVITGVAPDGTRVDLALPDMVSDGAHTLALEVVTVSAPPTCGSPAPGHDWLCVNGGWLPASHPGAIGASPATSSTWVQAPVGIMSAAIPGPPGATGPDGPAGIMGPGGPAGPPGPRRHLMVASHAASTDLLIGTPFTTHDIFTTLTHRSPTSDAQTTTDPARGITVPESGMYQVQWFGVVQGGQQGLVRVTFRVNDGWVLWLESADRLLPSDRPVWFSYETLLELNAGDVVGPGFAHASQLIYPLWLPFGSTLVVRQITSTNPVN